MSCVSPSHMVAVIIEHHGSLKQVLMLTSTPPSQKCDAQTALCDAGLGNSGDNIRAYMQSVRDHRVVLDPTVMVALMSLLVLEGWQTRLDPSVCIMDSVKLATGGGVMGGLLSAGQWYQGMLEYWGGDQPSNDESAA